MPINERAIGPFPTRFENKRLFEPPCARAAVTASVPLPQVNQLPCDDSNVPSVSKLVMTGMETFTSSTYKSTPAPGPSAQIVNSERFAHVGMFSVPFSSTHCPSLTATGLANQL